MFYSTRRDNRGMGERLVIRTGNGDYTAVLDDSDVSLALRFATPYSAEGNMISGCLYFEVPIEAIEGGNATTKFEVGDIAWWPRVGALCIFYGPTFLSEEDGKPISYHKMIRIGRIEGDCSGIEGAGDRRGVSLLLPEV